MSEEPKPDPPLDPDDKDGRGFDNDVTGYYLCPVDYNWNDPKWVVSHFQSRALLTWMVAIVIVPQYVTMILDSLLLRTRGRHSCTITEDMIQTVLSTVYSRVSCSSRCVREYFWVHRDRNSATCCLGLQAHLYIPNFGPQGEQCNPAFKGTPEMCWTADVWTCSFSNWHEVCLSSGNRLHRSSGVPLSHLLNLVFHPRSFQSLIILASLRFVQLWELADHWRWIQLWWLLQQHRRLLRECRNCRG